MIDNKTTNYLIPLPDAGNLLSEDVVRLISAFNLIDTTLLAKLNRSGGSLTGNLGIGETTPLALLHLTSAAPSLIFDESDAAANEKNWRFDAESKTFSLRTSTDDNATAVVAYAVVRGTGTAIDRHAWFAAGSERLRLASTGNFGIGTTNPESKLDVAGDMRLSGLAQNATGTRVLEAPASSDPSDRLRGRIIFGTTAGTTSSDSYLAFHTNKYGVSSGERVRIDPNGNVGIGLTAPAVRLHVYQAAVDVFARVQADAAKAAQLSTQQGSNFTFHGFGTDGSIAGVSTNAAAAIIFSNNNYTERMRINATGGVAVTGDISATGNVGGYSDRRLKNELTPISSALDKVLALNGYRFRWVDSAVPGNPGTYDYGVIADEVEAVFPEAIMDSGKEAPEGDNYKMVAYDKLIPGLIEAVKTLAGQCEALQARVVELEARA